MPGKQDPAATAGGLLLLAVICGIFSLVFGVSHRNWQTVILYKGDNVTLTRDCGSNTFTLEDIRINSGKSNSIIIIRGNNRTEITGGILPFINDKCDLALLWKVASDDNGNLYAEIWTPPQVKILIVRLPTAPYVKQGSVQKRAALNFFTPSIPPAIVKYVSRPEIQSPAIVSQSAGNDAG